MPGSLTAVVIPGKQFAETELWTPAKMNQGFNPTIQVTGALNQLSDVVAGSPTLNQALVWNGTNWVPGTVAGGSISVYVGATASAAGVPGAVPSAAISDRVNYLRGDGVWAPVTPNVGSELFFNQTFI